MPNVEVDSALFYSFIQILREIEGVLLEERLLLEILNGVIQYIYKWPILVRQF